MNSRAIPSMKKNPYKRIKYGYCGELGEGANAKIRFIQTVINQQELDDITLISNIPGSETWDVRDLFQRDVDDDRVEKEIMPYFKDKTKVKFFNPLTLIVLPMDDMGREVLKETQYISSSKSKIQDQDVLVYEKLDYYKFSVFQNEEYGQLEWNDHKCKLVAIDGQHRLSALKRWKKEPKSQFSDWRIPVVILNIFKVDKDKGTASLLEIVRKTFVYINTKAQGVNKAREILLNDESVNAICTQELIQYSHENDNKNIKNRDESIVPLIFYDWRGEVINNVRQYGPAAIKSIEEIYAWFNEYILFQDGSERQESQLLLTDLTPPLEGYGPDKTLSYHDAGRIRKQFKQYLLPGILYFLQNFKPYYEYIKECRKIEREAIDKSDNAHHAFFKLRFGAHNAPEDQFEAVNREYKNLVDIFTNLKDTLQEILSREIGMRGVMYAFGQGKLIYENNKNKSIDWLVFSKIFTDILNEIYDENWFRSHQNLDAKKRKLLTHIIFDDAGSIINYRVQQASEALGSLILILSFRKLLQRKEIKGDDFIELWDEQSNILRKTIEKGFRKFHKAQLGAIWTGSLDEFNKEVRKRAEKDSNKRITDIAKLLEIN